MRVSGIWSAIGLIIAAGIVADLVTHANGTKAAFNGINGLASTSGNVIAGKG